MNFQKHTIRVYNRDKLEYLLSPYSDCILCFDYPSKPIMALCGHIYCYKCVYELLEHKRICVCGSFLLQYIKIEFKVFENDFKLEENDMKRQIEAFREFEMKNKGNLFVEKKQDELSINGKKDNSKQLKSNKSNNEFNDTFERCIMRYGSYECDIFSNLLNNPIAARYQIDEEFFVMNLGNKCYELHEAQNFKQGFTDFIKRKGNTASEKTSQNNVISDSTKIEENKMLKDTKLCLDNKSSTEEVYIKNEATLRTIKKTKNRLMFDALYKTVSYQKYNGESFFMSKRSIQDMRKIFAYKDLPEYIEVVILKKKEMIYCKDVEYFKDGFLQHLCDGRIITICDVCFDF